MALEADGSPPSLEKRIDQACDGFEAAWQAGQRPHIEDYLADVPEPERWLSLLQRTR